MTKIFTKYTSFQSKGKLMDKEPVIELFENPKPGREYTITIHCPEFTSVCPKTGQPDFGEIVIEYVPDQSCIELKSLKFYMQSFRNMGIFYERLTRIIRDHLKDLLDPIEIQVEASFTPRGGLSSRVISRYVSGTTDPS